MSSGPLRILAVAALVALFPRVSPGDSSVPSPADRFDIRPIGRAASGKGVEPVRNTYGRKRSKLTALVFVPRSCDVREALEIFSGLNAEADVLVAAEGGGEVYESVTSPELVNRRLSQSEYGLFVITSRSVARIGCRMAAAVTAAVRAGAGLYLMHDGGKSGHFAQALKSAAPVSGYDFARAFPGAVFDVARCSFDPSRLTESMLGKGRVIREGAYRGGLLKIRMQMQPCGEHPFPFGRFADPYLARLFYRAAAMDRYGKSDVSSVKWLVVDALGVVRGRGEASDFETALGAAKKAPSTSGRHLAGFRFVDSEGFTLDFDARAFSRDGPRITQFKAVADSVSGDGPARFRIAASGENPVLSWTLADFSGRVLERGRAEGGREFEVPLGRLYTNMGRLRVQLTENGRVRDTRSAVVFARDRDRDRVTGDFTAAVLGARSSLSRDSFVQLGEILGEIGFRASVLPVEGGGHAQTLGTGMALGGEALDGGGRLRDIDLRTLGINTERGREALSRRAKESAKTNARYGTVQCSVLADAEAPAVFTSVEPDGCAENVDEYRRRMVVKYARIDAYNRRHGTSYRSFRDIRTVDFASARASGKFSEFIEWMGYNCDRRCEALNMISLDAGEIYSGCRLSLGGFSARNPLSGVDGWKLLTRSGLDMANDGIFGGTEGGVSGDFGELIRSFRPDMRLWGSVGPGMDSERIRFMPWYFAAHRYGGFTWVSAFGNDGALVDPVTLALTRKAQELGESLDASRLADGLGRLMLSNDWASRDIAVYRSHESLLVSMLLGKGSVRDFVRSRQGARSMIENLLYQFDCISPDQVSEGALKRYKALFMPHVRAMSDMEVEELKRFIAAGGRVIADELPGAYDELGVPRPGGTPFKSGELTLTGGSFDDRDDAQRRQAAAFLASSGARPIVRIDGPVSARGLEAVHFRCGNGDLFVFLRMPGSKGSGKVSAVLPVKGYIHDPFAGSAAVFGERIELNVPEGGAAVRAVLREKASPPAVAGLPESGKFRRGGDISLSLSLPAGGKAPDTVFNVLFEPPSGECRFHFRRNIDAPGGEARLVFPTAFNDERGTWKLTVRDAMTGLCTVGKFELE